MEKSFRSSEKFEEPDVEFAPASYLYSDADGCHFMEEKSYEQFAFSTDEVGSDRNYLKEGASLQVLKYNGAPVSLQLPQYVELAVVSTEMGLRGDTAAGGAPKMATLETGLEARVPLFIKKGEIVRVNTKPAKLPAGLRKQVQGPKSKVFLANDAPDLILTFAKWELSEFMFSLQQSHWF